MLKFSTASLLLTSFALLAIKSEFKSVQAYSWTFQNTPQQCSTLSIAISGDDGKPPYRALIVPYGPASLINGVDPRKVMDIPFPVNEKKVEFQMNYPAYSHFVVVVSDAISFASGGTSAAAMVTFSTDETCFDANATSTISFGVRPINKLVQCQQLEVFWLTAEWSGNATFLGIIPGGQSFPIAHGTYPGSTNYSWFSQTIAVRAPATLLVVGGDGRGNGTAGSKEFTVATGDNPDWSCLSGSSPSSTPGQPVGGTYPTSVEPCGNCGPPRSSSTPVGLIVGVVVGVLVLLIALIILFFLWRRRQKRIHREKESPADSNPKAKEDGTDAPG